MKFEPHPVQTAALKASNGAYGFGYFMEQGLGKTMTSYLDFLNMVEQGRASRKVVLAPNSFKGGWVAEAQKYDVPVEPFIFDSGNTWGNREFINRTYKAPPVLVVNYEAIRSEDTQQYVIKFLTGGRGGFTSADESIQISGFDSAQTKAAINIGKESTFTRILSGKPIKQGPHDLWAQMRFAKQLNGRMYYPFKNAFCKMGGFKMKQVVGAQNEDLLSPLIEPHVFRALKKDWTDLPPKVHTEREYRMSSEMAAMYSQMEEEFVLWLDEEGDHVAVDAAITKYIKLAQIQAGFIIKEDGSVHELVDPRKNPRVLLLKEIIDNELVGKICVPYHHRYVLDMLMGTFASYNPTFIKGGMSDGEIEANKQKFNTDPKCRIIFLQTRASKYGHTLLGDQSSPETACSTMAFFENTYSLDDRSQIEDRAHRHGQLQEMMLYIDLIGTGLDRNMVRALIRKEEIYQSVFRNIRSTQTPQDPAS